MAADTIKIKKSVAISENGAVFDSSLGNTFSVNETGNMILGLLREGKTNKAILEQLSTEFKVKKEQAEADVFEFINLLRQYKLLDKTS